MAGYVDRLSSDFCCVLVDPRGMGQSSRPAGLDGYAIGETAADVLAIADDLGVSQFAYWGGSQGGSVGLVLAVEQPQRLACLVLSGAWLDYAPDRPGRAKFARYLRESGDPGAVVREMCEAEGVPASHWIRSIHHGDCAVVAALLEGWLAYDWEDRAEPRQVAVPTLMIVGELEDPGREAEAVAEAMPHAQAMTMPGVGHIGRAARRRRQPRARATLPRPLCVFRVNVTRRRGRQGQLQRPGLGRGAFPNTGAAERSSVRHQVGGRPRPFRRSGIESEDDLVRFLVAPISEPAPLAHDHETALRQHANRRGVVARSASVKRTGCLQLQELL